MRELETLLVNVAALILAVGITVALVSSGGCDHADIARPPQIQQDVEDSSDGGTDGDAQVSSDAFGQCMYEDIDTCNEDEDVDVGVAGDVRTEKPKLIIIDQYGV